MRDGVLDLIWLPSTIADEVEIDHCLVLGLHQEARRTNIDLLFLISRTWMGMYRMMSGKSGDTTIWIQCEIIRVVSLPVDSLSLPIVMLATIFLRTVLRLTNFLSLVDSASSNSYSRNLHKIYASLYN